MIPETSNAVLAVILSVTATITSLLTTRIEPLGARVKPNWYSSYKPNLNMLVAVSILLAAGVTAAILYKNPLGLSGEKLLPYIPTDHQNILIMLMFGITAGITSASILQDLRDKTVPSISIVTVGIPAVIILQFLCQGLQWFPNLAVTIVEMLLIWGVVSIWEYIQWKKGGTFTQLENPEEFKLFRKFGKWKTSIGGADEPYWIDLATETKRAGIIVKDVDGTEIQGYRNRIVLIYPNGETKTHILDEVREDFSFQITEVSLPKQAMGRGDMHLACLFGLTLGPATALITICAGGILTVIGAFIDQKNLKEEMPMIPGMAIAFVVTLAFIPAIREYTDALIYLFR
jgi:prepilin signal peptidase PulO-like enzyme (type II secretory pathway)